MNLTGLTIGMLAYDKNNALVTMPGQVVVDVAVAGDVSYVPAAATDLLNSNSPMKIRWTLTDGNSDVDHVPTVEPDKWIIRLP